LAFAPTVVASGSPARSRSLLRVRSNGLDSSRFPSCASSSPHADSRQVRRARRVRLSPSSSRRLVLHGRLDCSSRPTEPALAVVMLPACAARRPFDPSHDVAIRFSKIAPPRFPDPRSPQPASMSPSSLRGPAASRPCAPPSWFDHLGGFSSPNLPGCCTGLPSWGSRCFRVSFSR